MGILNDIARRECTDKSSEFHNYCRKYEKYLPFARDEKIKLLEIGVFRGESLRMWKDYFFNSCIIGIDIDRKCMQYKEERIMIEIGSQRDGWFLASTIQKYKQFDLVIDDGSHVNSDMLFSFNKLFPYVVHGGVYVIEDCCTSYWKKFGGSYKGKDTSIEFCKDLVDDVNFRGLYSRHGSKYARKEEALIPLSLEVQPECRVDIESINFMNGLILITKR